MALEAQNNPYPSVLMVEGDPEALPDADPASGQRRLAVGTDHLLYLVDDSGVKHAVAGSSGLSDPMTTRGDVIVRNASNVTARLAIGSAGKVLSSDGTDVSWQTPGSGGALVLLEQHTASSSATLDFTTFISSTYDEYLFEIVSLMPATNTVDLLMRMGTGGGPTWDASSDYAYDLFVWRAGGVGEAGGTSQTSILLTFTSHINNTTAIPIVGSFKLYDPQNTAVYTEVSGHTTYYDSSPFRVTNQTRGEFTSTTAVTGVRFLCSSGNIASGTIRAYGIAK